MIKLPKEALEASKDYLPDYYYTNLPNIAFAINSLNGGQLSFIASREINKFLSEDAYREVSFYTLRQEPPIDRPNCAVYPIAELYQYKGPLIYLDIESFDFGSEAFYRDTAFYIYDVNLLNFVAPYIKENIRKYKGKIITRSKDHARLLYTITGINCNSYVPEFNVGDLWSIING